MTESGFEIEVGVTSVAKYLLKPESHRLIIFNLLIFLMRHSTFDPLPMLIGALFFGHRSG